MQKFSNIVDEENRKKGLERNSKKIAVMVVSRNNECPQINIFSNRNKLKQRDQFKYLDILILSDGHSNIEIASRIVQAKKSFQRMTSILTNITTSRFTRTLECYIELILMNGCEAWTISKQLQKKLEATEIDSYRECYESHGLQRNPTKQCYEKLTQDLS